MAHQTPAPIIPRRVVVTGLGIVSPVGNTVEEAWRRVVAGESGIATIANFDPSRLAGLTVVDGRYPNAKFEHDARNVANGAAVATIYGADELTERLALISLDGKLYEVGFTLLRYGDDWRISSQTSALGNTAAVGTAAPTTQDDYDRETSGE